LPERKDFLVTLRKLQDELSVDLYLSRTHTLSLSLSLSLPRAHALSLVLSHTHTKRERLHLLKRKEFLVTLHRVKDGLSVDFYLYTLSRTHTHTRARARALFLSHTHRLHLPQRKDFLVTLHRLQDECFVDLYLSHTHTQILSHTTHTRVRARACSLSLSLTHSLHLPQRKDFLVTLHRLQDELSVDLWLSLTHTRKYSLSRTHTRACARACSLSRSHTHRLHLPKRKDFLVTLHRLQDELSVDLSEMQPDCNKVRAMTHLHFRQLIHLFVMIHLYA